MDTTHPTNTQHFRKDRDVWKRELEKDGFAGYKLPKVEVKEEIIAGDGKTGTVFFTAYMRHKQKKYMTSFDEKSEFSLDEDGIWRYCRGEQS